MEDELIKSVELECNLVERIFFKLFKKMIIKIYNIARINTINNILEK